MILGVYSPPSIIVFITAITVILALTSVFYEYRKAKALKLLPHKDYLYKKVSKVAVLIASKDGEKTITRTVKAAIANRCTVYVVSDGSSDKTVREARAAGAQVLGLKKNIGKPAALHRAYKHFKLGQNYSAIAILDDDVMVEKDFIRHAKKSMGRDCAITVGKNLTDWPNHKRWNVWLASRTYSYWAYQITLRTIQSTYNVMNCISGSNSLYRTEVLDRVLTGDTPYIVDDTYWTLETHRLKLGKIKYSPKARAWLQDPINFRDWYSQNLRWMWGTFQGIIGHRVGTKANKFHLSYLAIMFEWIIYIFSGPLTLFVIWQAGLDSLALELLLLCTGYAVLVTIAAIALKLPRLLLFVPVIVVTDFLFRWVMLHGLFKAIRQKTVASCVWNSPERFDTRGSTLGQKAG
ncbi:glycosyltransferase family 2 protein [Candidatus Saccharibacteria bacterium]|nr:glycosyltransferase family 2 protein [Candidatus Saccharibacteria bacterium]